MRKHGRRDFEPKTPRRPYKRKTDQVSPLHHVSSKRTSARETKQAAFVCGVQQYMKEHDCTAADASFEVGWKQLKVRKRDRNAWLAKHDSAAKDAGLSPGLAAPKKLDARLLRGNAAGQGRPSEWTKKSRDALVQYLISVPEVRSGVAQWPSCSVLAADEKLQKKLKVPKQTAQNYMNIAREEELEWATRSAVSVLFW